MKIVLDPGHGQFGNPGVIKGYYEGTQMWKLGQYMQEIFVDLGWEVTNTRPKLTDAPSLERRGQMAKDHDLFVSLHSNAPGPTAVNYFQIRGVAVYDSVADRMDYLEVPLAAEAVRIMGTKNNGVKHRWNTRDDRQGQDYYGVLRNAVTVAGCPDAMLIEFGYHTNMPDCAWLMLDNNLRMLAYAVTHLVNRLWRKQNNLPDFKEENDMVYCKRGDGSVVTPDASVTEMQNGFIKLGIEMKSPTTGTVFIKADGSYGPASAVGVQNFEQKYGMPSSDGGIFSDLHVRVMLRELAKRAGSGITQAQLDAETQRANKAVAVASEYKAELVAAAKATVPLDKHR